MSFLDLLSGALGAVLILFIIIPKLTSDIKLKLEKLDQLIELEKDVTKMENSLAELKKTTVDKKLVEQLETQINKVQSTIEKLSDQIKDLQNELGKCDEQRTKLKEEVKSLKAKVKELEKQLKDNGSIVEALKKEIKEKEETITQKEQQITNCEQEQAKMQITIDDTQKEVDKLEITKKDLSQEVEELKKELEKEKKKNAKLEDKVREYEAGFKFSDKNVVFVVDISGSMDDDPEPQKMDEVKAGLKMMIATMDDSYKVDVVIFPKSQDEKYGYKYGQLKQVSEGTKYDIYNYLNNLRPAGCTPTKEAMEFVMKSGKYPDAGTIILMSDGLPTNRVSYTDCEEIKERSGLAEVESFITSTNGGKRVINCVGVGKDFRKQSTTDQKVVFMKNVAKQNKGFYIGF